MRMRGEGNRRLGVRGALAALAVAATAATAAACGSEDASRPAGDPEVEGKNEVRREAPLVSGGERVAFIGDSLAVEAPPNFPELLPGELGRRAPGVETVNLAEPGTTAGDWLPGSAFFEERLAPGLADADVVAVTLGGNDLQEALGAADGIEALGQAGSGEGATDSAFAALDRLSRQLSRIFEEIRKRAPGAAIVFVGYPDYAAATVWREAGGTLGTIALGVGLAELVDAAAAAGPDLLLDMTGPTARAGVDSLLADTEHLSTAGHELYARRLAAALTR